MCVSTHPLYLCHCHMKSMIWPNQGGWEIHWGDLAGLHLGQKPSAKQQTGEKQWMILVFKKSFFLMYLLIMLLQLSHFPPLTPLHPAHALPPTFPSCSSCPWVILISSLASTFPTLFLPSPYFPPIIYATYSLYLSPLSPPPNPLLITLHVSSISVVLFLF